ncbi:MAG: hypothetical protein RI929_379 [Actinomycetota bacterium]|jgi:hypothetical protein
MSAKITFSEPADISDLKSFLERAKRLDDGGVVKFKATGDVLAVYVAPIFSGSLLGGGTTVLGLRTMRLTGDVQVDANFEISAILDRLAKPTVFITSSLELPPVSVKVAWAGITPPRDGWMRVAGITQPELSEVAKAGIAEVASLLPTSIGASIAGKVRQDVWGRLIAGDSTYPAGAAFAMTGLGFLTPDEVVDVFQAPGWLRFSSQNGHVLCRFQSAS